ncbi:MAG: CHAD domain-containing protein [Tardiphaga sp.]|nr:CHAD domain-containing protein [Tardiphaga sp.]
MTASSSASQPGPNCQSAFQRMARPCVALIRDHRGAACRGRPEAIHQIRIGLTRLQAARKFFAAMTQDGEWPWLKTEIIWLNSALGPARDNDVTTGHVRTGLKQPLAAKDSKLMALATRRSHRRLTSVLRSKRYDRLIAALSHWIDAGPWLTTGAAAARHRRRQILADYAAARLQRWKRRLVRDSAGGMKGNRRRHRLRIAAKRYRYMREALLALGIPESRSGTRQREAAQFAQRALGDLRDLQRLRNLQPQDFPVRIYRRRKMRLLRQARQAFRSLR